MKMMKSHKVTSAEDYKIVSSFQSLRKTLLEDKFADRLEKPLAYWAMPNDRRLPLAFLGRTIKDLLDTPFEELSATPGIGQKKISSLVKLLSRATKDHPPAIPFGMNDLADAKRAAEKIATKKPKVNFDPAIVSEALWTQWLETARKHGVGRELLGRLAPTLQALPTVIWQTPLEFYMQYSVSEIRQLKTHGEKRVRVVLEVFHIVHEMLVDVSCDRHLSVHLVPKFIEPLEDCIAEWMNQNEIPSPDEIRQQLTIPLLDQLQIDTGDVIHQLSCGRLGIDGPPQSVRQQSKQMGVTRARVYQLLEDCARVMDVRWPNGKTLLARLCHKFQTEATPDTDLKLLLATVELFYPGKRGLVDDEPVEQLVHAG
jgi:hypothetical protein